VEDNQPAQIVRAIRVCAVEELPAGEAVRIPQEENGTDDAIAVFNADGRFYALNDTCTHAGASLAAGSVEDGEVECPAHGSRFSLETGTVTAAPATRGVGAYQVEVRDGGVWLMMDLGPRWPGA
jgi:3-phenylpropionate/trans-cinnamate dioxygenase ferredoxin subunit